MAECLLFTYWCEKKKKKIVGKEGKLCKYNSLLILCQASGLRSSPQTFINPSRAIKGGIRGPKETKSWWIELISPPMMDGPVHRGLQNRSIVHLSLRLPCPSMICTLVVKATSGQKPSLSSPSFSTSLCVSPLPRNSHSSPFFLRPHPRWPVAHAARCTKPKKWPKWSAVTLAGTSSSSELQSRINLVKLKLLPDLALIQLFILLFLGSHDNPSQICWVGLKKYPKRRLSIRFFTMLCKNTDDLKKKKVTQLISNFSY